jgi:hypothetical protein
MRPKATLVSLLLKFILLLFFGVLIYFGGLNSMLMLIVLSVVAAVLLYFWHERVEVIRVIAVAITAPVLEIIATTPSLEIYSYASQELVTVPIWLPSGWACFTLVTFRFLDDVISILDLEEGALFLLENKRVLLFIEILVLAVYAVIVLFTWKASGEINPALLLFVLAFLNLILCFFYNRKADIILLPIFISFAMYLEFSGIKGEVWEYSVSDLWGMPLCVPFAYPFMMFIFNRFALDIDAIIEERKTTG